MLRRHVDALSLEPIGEMDRADPRVFPDPPPPKQTIMRGCRTCLPGVPDEIGVDDGLVLPTTALQIELTESGHVDRAQPKAPSSWISASLVPEPPLDILEAEWGEQDLVGIAEQISAGGCGDHGAGNRGVAITVVVDLARLVNERRT